MGVPHMPASILHVIELAGCRRGWQSPAKNDNDLLFLLLGDCGDYSQVFLWQWYWFTLIFTIQSPLYSMWAGPAYFSLKITIEPPVMKCAHINLLITNSMIFFKTKEIRNSRNYRQTYSATNECSFSKYTYEYELFFSLFLFPKNNFRAATGNRN